MIALGEYLRLKPGERVRYLGDHVADTTDLREEFCLAALPHEESALAKWHLVKALGLHRASQAVGLLIAVGAQSDVDFGSTSLHRVAAWSLGRIGETAFHPVMSLLDSGEEEQRVFAADALGEIGDARAVEALCASLREDVREVKLWAALSLAKIGEPALSCLHKLMLESPGLATDLFALDAVGKIGSSHSTPTIRTVLQSGTMAQKRFILEHIQDFWDPLLLPELRAITESTDEVLSELARSTVARLGPSEEP